MVLYKNHWERTSMAPRIFVLLTPLALLLMADGAWAHGEAVRGTGSGALNTIGAEINTGLSFFARYDRRSYDLFTDQELLDFRRRRGEDVHQHELEETVFISASIGLTENADLALQLPLVRFSGFKDNSDEFAIANDTLSVTDVSEGLGDLLIFGQYRFWKYGDHHLAALAGLKLPTGNVRQRTNNGDIVGTHNQPGSGSVDFQLGVAYSGHFLDERLGIAADMLGRINTEGAGSFRSGNALQLDVALIGFPHSWVSPIAELNFITQERDIEFDDVKRNSGVTSLFATVGLSFVFRQRFTVFALGSLPLVQSFPGISNDEAYRVGVGVGVSFDRAIASDGAKRKLNRTTTPYENVPVSGSQRTQ